MSVVLAIATPYLVSGRTYSWFLGYGGASCTDTCEAFGRTCLPARLPSDAPEMQSVAEQAHVSCANIQRVGADSAGAAREKFSPAYEASSSTSQPGTCYYPSSTMYSTCAEIPGSTSSGQKYEMRFCPCGLFNGIQWLLSNPGENCDSACSTRGGICGNVGDVWPVNEAQMSELQISGHSCSSYSVGTDEAAPNLGSDGVCHWSKSRSGSAMSQCSTSNQGIRRICPCYDVDGRSHR